MRLLAIRARPDAILLIAGCWLTALTTTPAFGIPVSIRYLDVAGEGFYDAELGDARRAAFEYAADFWTRSLAGEIEVAITASIDPLGGSGATALLASTGIPTLHRNFPGAPLVDVLYGPALANQLADTDVNGENLAEIDIVFNGDIDGNVVLGSSRWYYGTDGAGGNDIDFVTIALHEIGHGLGFFQQVRQASGQFAFGNPGIFDLQLVRPRVGALTTQLAAERRISVISNDLFWDGPYVRAAAAGPVRVFAPASFQAGSSVAHWDTSLDELMAPFYLGPNHDPGLLIPALLDLGWELAGGTMLPTAPPTPTPSQTPAPTPTGIAGAADVLAFISNFDDDSVSIIDNADRQVIDTLSVGDGPLDVVADTQGHFVYVANLRAGTISVVSARNREVDATIDIDGTPGGLAVSPDGSRLYVADTGADQVLVICTDERTPMQAISVGKHPSGVAFSPDGQRLYVTHFGENTVSVIDPHTDLVRALVVLDSGRPDGLRGFAFSPQRARVYVNRILSPGVSWFNSATLNANISLDIDRLPDELPNAITVGLDERYAYVALHDTSTAKGRLGIRDLTNAASSPRALSIGDGPEAMALTPDGAFLYIANALSDSVTIIDTQENRTVSTIAVGSAPMGAAIAGVPRLCTGDCDGDGETTVEELLAGISIALGTTHLDACPPLDRDRSGEITIDEILAALTVVLEGCA